MAEHGTLPVTESADSCLRKRIRCLHRVSQLPEDPGSYLRNVPGNGSSLAAAPPLATFLDLLGVELALADQELDEVFQTWPVPAAADGDVQGCHFMRCLMTGAGEQVRERAAMAMDMHMS